jgi:hypothetical protein
MKFTSMKEVRNAFVHDQINSKEAVEATMDILLKFTLTQMGQPKKEETDMYLKVMEAQLGAFENISE